MAILAIDTSMSACSAAVLKPGDPSALQRYEPMTRGHAEALFPMIEAVMGEAQCNFAELSRIAATIGPGSFTGVRAGLAAARGFALAANIPIVAATSLEVMALGCVRRLAREDIEHGFAITHDARREQLYFQTFDREASALSEPAVLNLPEALEALQSSIHIVAGTGAQLLANAAAAHGRALRVVIPDLLPEAADLATIAAKREGSDHPPKPLYLRPPDAKPQTGKSLARAPG